MLRVRSAAMGDEIHVHLAGDQIDERKARAIGGQPEIDDPDTVVQIRLPCRASCAARRPDRPAAVSPPARCPVNPVRKWAARADVAASAPRPYRRQHSPARSINSFTYNPALDARWRSPRPMAAVVRAPKAKIQSRYVRANVPYMP